MAGDFLPVDSQIELELRSFLGTFETLSSSSKGYKQATIADDTASCFVRPCLRKKGNELYERAQCLQIVWWLLSLATSAGIARYLYRHQVASEWICRRGGIRFGATVGHRPFSELFRFLEVSRGEAGEVSRASIVTLRWTGSKQSVLNAPAPERLRHN